MTRFSLLFLVVVATLSTTEAQDANQSDAKQSGIDKSLFSESIAAGDNFYLYANEKWLSGTKIPEDKSNYGIFTVLNDLTQEQVRALIETAAKTKAAAGSAAQKVGDLYSNVLNTEARNSAGIEPIQPLLDLVGEVSTTNAAAKTLGKLAHHGVYGPLAAYVSIDAKKSDTYTVYVTQSGLTLPDRDYYLEDDQRYVELREKLVVYIEEMLEIAGQANAKEAAQHVFDIESRIAKSHWTKTANRDPIETYNQKTPEEIGKLMGEFNWTQFVGAAGVGLHDSFVVRQPSYFSDMGDMFADVPASHWQEYLAFHVIDTYGDALSESIERKHFDFHSTAISGISEQEPLWKRGVNITGSALGELVGQLYVEKHFAPEAKVRMGELVDMLKRAFVDRINTRDWMGDGTKKQALEKLSLFTTKIGYPDEWKDYDNLQIQAGPLAASMMASAQFEYERDLQKLGGPIDRGEWHMTTAND